MPNSLKILVYFLIAFPALAKVSQQKSPQFVIDVPLLEKGHIQAFIDTVPAHEFNKKYSQFEDLDALRFAQEKDTVIRISKSAYVVDRPAGYFSDQLLMDVNWLGRIHPQDTFAKLSDNSFNVTSARGQHLLEIFYDSDDQSNVQRPRLIHAVALTKRTDPLAAGSFATSCSVITKSSMPIRSQVEIANYISLSSRRTIVILYQISALAKAQARQSVNGFADQLVEQVSRINKNN